MVGEQVKVEATVGGAKVVVKVGAELELLVTSLAAKVAASASGGAKGAEMEEAVVRVGTAPRTSKVDEATVTQAVVEMEVAVVRVGTAPATNKADEATVTQAAVAMAAAVV